MNKFNDAQSIWQLYERGVEYNQSESVMLYERVQQNENFFIGKQWEGLNAPDLEKPVLNFLKRVVTYFISMLVSDDISVSIDPFIQSESDQSTIILAEEIKRVIERTKAKALHRDMLRNAAVDGDGCFYLRFDPEMTTGQTAKGEIVIENIDNTNVIFGNPYTSDVQRQPYIIIVKREITELLKERARRMGCKEADSIQPDSASDKYAGEQEAPNALTTVLITLFKNNGTIRYVESTVDVIIKPETDTGCKLYPVAYMSWEKIKNSYHGQSPITGLIPNQIAVNRLLAMAIHSVKSTAFPKILYDVGKIDKWTNRVGEAIAVNGNPNEAIASSFRSMDMSAQVVQMIDSIINWTKDLMGASDAALGSVKPDNTSAIIAVQQASAVPLELQRLAFFQFVEDYVRIIIDIICSYYGVRMVSFEGVQDYYNFSSVDYDALNINVEVGKAAYWNELMQLQTLDNLFNKGIIQDAILYLEQIPDGYIKNKQELIEHLKQQQMQLQQMQASQDINGPQAKPAMPTDLIMPQP